MLAMSEVALFSKSTVLLLLEMAAYFGFIFQINFRLAIVFLFLIILSLRHLHLRLHLLGHHHLGVALERRGHLPVELGELGLHIVLLLHHHVGKLRLPHAPLVILAE